MVGRVYAVAGIINGRTKRLYASLGFPVFEKDYCGEMRVENTFRRCRRAGNVKQKIKQNSLWRTRRNAISVKVPLTPRSHAPTVIL